MSKEYIDVVRLLLKGANLVTFEYWSEFVIRIQRDEATRHPMLLSRWGNMRIPSLFCLRLRNAWWIGNETSWCAELSTFPIKGVRPIQLEGPLQAARLMQLLGREVTEIYVNGSSDLTLELVDERITVKGSDGEWEESWILDLPVDDPDRDLWTIICESDGRIYGRVPDDSP